jgi:DNA polymerase-3 subunit alpha
MLRQSTASHKGSLANGLLTYRYYRSPISDLHSRALMFVATTEFSLGQSLLSVPDIVKIAGDNKLDTVVVTDTMSVTSLIPLAEKLGEKLVTGVRMTLVDKAEQERQNPYQPKVYPVDEKGMAVLFKYLTKAYERPYFYELPRLDFDSFYAMLKEAPESFYVSTGDINSILKHEHFRTLLGKIIAIVGDARMIYDIIPAPSPLFDLINFRAFDCYTSNNLMNVYMPALYKKEDADVFPIHFSISKNVEFNYLKPSHKLYYYEPTGTNKLLADCLKRLKTRFSFVPKPPYNKVRFDERYKWKPQAPRLPKLSATPMDSVRKLAISGLKERTRTSMYGYQPSIEDIKGIYVPRLKYEFEVVEKLGFSDYFLMVYELTDWCKKQDIKIGPGRGSVGGSLIAFCMGITDVDPIRFGLMFERFINPTRIDLPDIDLDFMSTRRHEIVEHLNDRYGRDSVAGIINYAKLGSKSALRSTCRILGMDDSEYTCSKLIPSQFGFSKTLEESKEAVIDINNFSKKYPDVWGKALKLENKLRNFSTHAAGIIVSNRPLVHDAVIQTSKGQRVINWDKKLCEKQGLVKLDVLGLTTLDIIDLCLSYIRTRHGTTVDLHRVPLDLSDVLDSFASGNTGGIFQFEGGSVRRLLKELSKHEALHFDDLVAATALNRPGPIEAGLVQMYIDGKNGTLHDVDHPSMAEALAPTYNVMVYQEQVMKVAVEFAGYTLPEADNLRKIMGKKLPEEMKKEADKFIEGAVKTHAVDRGIATHVFDQISKFAFYAFNKSHSVEYSLLSYLCMWLKVNYPVEYYAASLTYIDDKKVRAVINEAKKNGITIDAPSVNLSTDKFHPVSDNRIVAPLSKIKFVQAAATLIMEERRYGGAYKSIDDLVERTTKRVGRKAVNKRVVEAMQAVGALDEIAPPIAPVCPVERSKAINEYLPSIPLGHVAITREMKPNAVQKKWLLDYLEKCKAELGDDFVVPYAGKEMRFMIVYDCATASEAKSKMFTETRAFSNQNLAMHKADLTKADAYFTGLVKRGKEKKEKIFSNAVLEKSFERLLQEIAILEPTVILCLGNQVAKMFDPTLKGGATDNAGKVIYRSDLDCNVVVGFNPSQLFFNPDYEPILVELFETVSDML